MGGSRRQCDLGLADAHVVLCARRRGQHVVTSDPDDLRHLDPALELIVL